MTVTETKEFTFTHTFDAPRAAVWKAWTSAEALGQWWGPKGANIRVIAFDLRPGGMFHYAMASQSGQEMYGRFIYREIISTAWVTLRRVSSRQLCHASCCSALHRFVPASGSSSWCAVFASPSARSMS